MVRWVSTREVALEKSHYSLAFKVRWCNHTHLFRRTAKNLVAYATSWSLTLSPACWFFVWCVHFSKCGDQEKDGRKNILCLSVIWQQCWLHFFPFSILFCRQLTFVKYMTSFQKRKEVSKNCMTRDPNQCFS